VQVLIETRGEGGYTVEAPSHGTVHPTGGTYRLVSGGVGMIVTITSDERRRLWTLAETFDQMPESAPSPVPSEVPMPEARPVGSGPTVIEDFNARATWREILESHGWTEVHRGEVVGYWRRPGKDRYWSATTNFGGADRLCVFSTATVFKTTDRQGSKAGYSKFGAYALLNHGDDARAAVRELGQRGYGSPLPSITLDDAGGTAWFTPPARRPRRPRPGMPVATFDEAELAAARASLAGFVPIPWVPRSPEPVTAAAPEPRPPVSTIERDPICPLCNGPGAAGGRACSACMAS